MSALREWVTRLLAFATRRRDTREVDEELRFHLEMTEERLRASGLSGDEARRQARLTVGGAAQIAEAYRDQRSLPFAETLVQDLRYGLRMLRRAPALSAAALLTLAIGIGANTAVFSIVNAVLLRPLPYADPGRLVMVGDRAPDGSASNLGFATFQDLRDQNRTLESLAAIRSWDPTLVTSGEAERLPGMRVSWNYFDLLGVRPALGRTFTPEDDRRDQWRVVLLSDGLWRRRFGSDPSVVGRTLTMNDRQYRIIGVLPAGYEPLVSAHFYQPAQIWAALGYDTSLDYACRSCEHLKAIGRLRPTVTRAQALADVGEVRRQLRDRFPAEYPPGEMAVEPLQDVIAGRVKVALYVLLGAVGFVLLIACGNVANLLLARSMTRSREMALRVALGAGRRRLVRQLLTESLALSVIGGALGVAMAAFALQAVSAFAPVSIPRLDQAGLDWRVLGFAGLISVGTGLLFGLLPALRGSAHGPGATLAADSRSSVGHPAQRARAALVVADLALALVLLAGAGLMLRTVAGLLHVDPGFDPSGVLTLNYSLGGRGYAENGAVIAFMDRTLDRVGALPGVRSAAIASQVPLGGNYDAYGFHIEGRMKANPSEDPSAQRYSVTPDYFRTLGIRLLKGRLLTADDRADSMPVLLVSQTAAERFFPNEDPIGHRVRTGGSQSGPWRTIVGVVADVNHQDLVVSAEPQMYVPQTQWADGGPVMIVKSASVPPASLVASVREALRGIDPAIPVYDVATMDERASRTMADRRFVMRLLGGFAAVALLLAAIGLYGVVSYSVTARTRELGVRVALGAGPADILRPILTSGLTLVVIGLAAGVAAALVLLRSLRSLLVGVEAADPATFAGAVGILAVVAIAAHVVPARRALNVDPAIALRQE